MNTLLEIITTALSREDIEGLLESGAPQDEYDAEAEVITSVIEKLIPEHMTEENIVLAISRVWAGSFNRSSEEIEQRLPAFHHIAQDILSAVA